VNKYWNNLRPFEKRVVVVVAAALFVIFNFWYVFPHFSDWSRVQHRKEKAYGTLRLFQPELDQADKYRLEIAKLQGEGLSVPPEDQILHFSSAILTHAAQAGVTVTTTGRTTTRTNDPFFLEQSQAISTLSGEKQLVEFLYSLGSGDSLIRVLSFGLRPDPPRQSLVASITLVASYQKKSSAKSSTAASAAPATASAAAAKPPAAPAPKPATPAQNPPGQAPKSQKPDAAKPGSPPSKPGIQTNKPAKKP
jgi:hypothetical protein